MGNAAIIEVAIGLIFVFSLLSILVTQINSLIVNFLNLRAKRLKEQLDVLLTDPVIRAKVFTHPLIGMVRADEGTIILTDPNETISAQAAQALTEDKRARVGYINPNEFSDVLVDILTARTGQKLYEELIKVINDMPASVDKSKFRELLRQIQLQGTGMPELRDLIELLTDEETKRKMLFALNLVDAALDKFQVDRSELIPLVLGIRQIRDKYMRAALEAVISASSSLDDAKAKLSYWFDNSMDHASEVFQAEMQRFSLVIGFLLALILNVDTLHMGRILWEDPALRTAVVATAAVNAPQLEARGEQEATGTEEGDLVGSFQATQDTLRQLLDLRLPIGWHYSVPTEDDLIARDDARNLWVFIPGNSADWFGLVLRKIIGLVVTAIAVAQGAPFWFDLLRRLAQGRSG